jgi:hypothetical protein
MSEQANLKYPKDTVRTGRLAESFELIEKILKMCPVLTITNSTFTGGLSDLFVVRAGDVEVTQKDLGEALGFVDLELGKRIRGQITKLQRDIADLQGKLDD